MIKTMDLPTFKEKFLQRVKTRGESQFEEIKTEVQTILDAIRQNGDTAIIKYEEKFDNVSISKDQMKVTSQEIEEAYSQVEYQIINAIKQVIKNISTFHEAQKRDTWYVEPVRVFQWVK